MEGHDLNRYIRRSLEVLVESADELRELDQALGDGDLGITITAGSRTVVTELEKLPDDASPTDLARTCAKSFASANPSTMAALVAGALLAGSRVWEGRTDIGLTEAAEFTDAAARSIAHRGKTEVGDKTILDGIAAAAAALQGADERLFIVEVGQARSGCRRPPAMRSMRRR